MGYILTRDSKIICSHGGIVQHSPRSIDVPYIQGNPVCLMHDTYDIVSCPLRGTLRCGRVEWLSGSEMTANGSPILTHLSAGLCYSYSGLLIGHPIIIDYQREYLADEAS